MNTIVTHQPEIMKAKQIKFALSNDSRSFLNGETVFMVQQFIYKE